jgi:hypothetical protein
MAPRKSDFDALVEAAKGLIPEVAQDLRLNISDANLLRLAAREALNRWPCSRDLILMTALVGRHHPVVERELARLLTSLATVTAQIARAAMTRVRCRMMGVYRRTWAWS